METGTRKEVGGDGSWKGEVWGGRHRRKMGRKEMMVRESGEWKGGEMWRERVRW